MKKYLLLIVLLFAVVLAGCNGEVANSSSNGTGDSDIGNTGDSDNTGGSGNVSGDEDTPATKYKVTFYGNGADEGQMAQVECDINGIVLPKNEFSKKDYKFMGWAVSAEDVVSYKNMQVLVCKSDVDLYAYWSEVQKDITGDTKTFKIFYNANGSGETMGSSEIKDGEIITLKDNIFSRNGYVFKGWSSLSGGDVEYLDKGFIELHENITLYAVWEKINSREANTVKVTLDPLGSGKDREDFYVLSSKEFYPPYNKITNGNKVFAGWSTIPNSNKVEYQEGKYGFFYEDTTLYGVWLETDQVYKVDLNCNGGMAINMPESIYIPKTDKLFIPRISCDLFNRKSKNMYTADLEDILSNKYVSGREYEITNDTKLYALWNVDDYTLDATLGGDCEDCKEQTFFANMVQIPKDEDWVLKENQTTKTVRWKEGVNWFHVYQRSYNLCWAASASSIFHWWNIVNDKYIKAYYDYKQKNNESITKPDLSFFPKDENNFHQSEIYELFATKGYWPNSGNKAGIGMIWLVSGLSNRAGAAYFKEVFENAGVQHSQSYESVGKADFNRAVTSAFKDKKGVVSIGTVTTGPHAITVWGATYDSDGYVNGIYTSDSAISAKTMEKDVWGGLEYDEVIYSSSGKPYMKNKANSTFPINTISVIFQNEEAWKKYLDDNKINYAK